MKICCTGVGVIVDGIGDYLNLQEKIRNYKSHKMIDEIHYGFDSYIKKFMEYIDRAFVKALDDSKISTQELKRNSRIGVVLGSSLGYIDALEFEHGNRIEARSIDFSWLIEKYQVSGPMYIVSNTCASGMSALSIAQSLLIQNTVDICIVGAVDLDGHFIKSGFKSMNMLSAKEQLDLFSSNQDGTILSSGAACLVFERESSAKNSYAELLSISITNDAFDLARIDKEGRMLKKAILDCIDKSGLTKNDIDVIITCANGVKHMDVSQSNIINDLFGDRETYYVSSVKQLIGHALGASSIIDVIAAIEYMRNERILPICSTNYYDIPSSFLEALNERIDKVIENVLLISVGFSGVNGAGVLHKTRRCE